MLVIVPAFHGSVAMPATNREPTCGAFHAQIHCMLRGRPGVLTGVLTEESAEGGVPWAAIVPRCAATRTLGRCRSAAGTAVGPGVGGSQSPGPPPGGGEQMASRPDTPTCRCMTIFGKPCARSLKAAMVSSVHCALVSVVLLLK